MAQDAVPNRSARFTGQAALVTGGGSGLGFACAELLAREGAHVTICGRDPARLKEAAGRLGDLARTAVCDVSDEDQVARAVAVAAEATGQLNLAVVNVGFGAADPVLTLDKRTWDAVIGTNLTGAFLTLKHAARLIAAAGGGSIVAMSSVAGGLTHRFMAPYNASKAGLEMLVRTAADELGVHHVRVNALRPGIVPTAASDILVDTEPVRLDYLAKMPLSRIGQPADVANAAAFLLSDDSSWITGQILNVDGGHHLRGGPDIDPIVAARMGPEFVATVGLGPVAKAAS